MTDNMYLRSGEWVWNVKEFNPLEYSESTWAPAELKAEVVLENMARAACKNEKYRLGGGLLVAKKVIFNPPATIVIWEDGTKTIVKCMEGDGYDAEKGLALCYMKKACTYYGFSYQKELKQAKEWTKENQISAKVDIPTADTFPSPLIDAANKIRIKILGNGLNFTPRICKNCDNRDHINKCPLIEVNDYGARLSYPKDDEFCSRWKEKQDGSDKV